ncbi:MAG: hypothetical protein EOP62_15905 [Sphingomonadales bacterium]|nr:MAG: hypothetical protein EOP62_15905 [Sphingomonadales bacterium]
MFKKFAAIAAASALVVSATAAQAGTASALSLRTATVTKKANKQAGPINPLFIVLGLVGAVAVAEVTGVIDVFSDSP